MKKVFRFFATVIIVLVVHTALYFLIEGVPLFGVPDVKTVSSVIVEHIDYPDETQVHTEEDKIKLAIALLGYLDYSPFKKPLDDTPIIKITYITNDGTQCVVSANNTTVWWNGKARAINDENTFVKMCTAVFFVQDR